MDRYTSNWGHCVPCAGQEEGFFRTSCASWPDARAERQAGGGDLVVILDEAKNAQATAFMSAFNDYGSC